MATKVVLVSTQDPEAQAPETKACAYYVCEIIHMMASEMSKSDRQQWFKDVREQLLPTERIRAPQEEIAGFLLDQVIDPKREYHYPLPPHEPLPIVIVLRRHQLG